MANESTPKRSFREVLAMLVSGTDRTLRSIAKVLNSLAFPVAVVDQHGKILTVNKCWMQAAWQTGLVDETPPGPGADYLETCRRAADSGRLRPSEAATRIRGICDATLSTSEQLEYACSSSADARWFSMTVTPLSDRGGAVITIRDISELRRIEAALEENEKLRQIAGNVPAMIWMTTADTRCIYFNRQWLDFTGRSLDQELGNGWLEGIHPDDIASFRTVFFEAFEKRRTFRLEHRLRCSYGEYRWVLNTGTPLFEANGEFSGFVGSCVDTTDQRVTEQTLVDLSGRLIYAQEEERGRVARELHDNLSQQMALLAIEIEQLAQDPSHSGEPISADLHDLLNKVQELSQEIHRISYALHPSKLDRLGLAAATLSLCREAAHQCLEVECDFDKVPDDLPRDTALCLYRVIQESIQNIIKHSGACSARVELHGFPSEIRLRISDEGVGFNPHAEGRKDGLGLLSMRERLRLIGGTISIESQPLRGTRIAVVVPLQRPSG